MSAPYREAGGEVGGGGEVHGSCVRCGRGYIHAVPRPCFPGTGVPIQLCAFCEMDRTAAYARGMVSTAPWLGFPEWRRPHLGPRLPWWRRVLEALGF